MAKRIILISSGPVLLALVCLALIFAGIGRGGLTYTSADVEQAKAQIVSFIEAGKLAEADAAVDNLIAARFAGEEKGQALQQIAGKYLNAQQFNKAIELADYVLKNWPKADFAVLAGMTIALSQAAKGDITASEGTTDWLIADYAGDANLPAAIATIADTYCWRRMYDRSERLYRVILDKSPDSAEATKARLGLARVEVLTLIEKKKFSLAQQQVNSMAVDFNDGPDLSAALFQIGQEFFWQRKYVEARDAFDQLIEKSPVNLLSQQARLWSARANVCALIWQNTSQPGSRQAKDEEVVAAIDKLISDFEGDAGLPDALFWISKEYEWSKGPAQDRTGWYDEPNSVYQRLVEQFKNTSYSQQSEWGQKRLAHRIKILKLIKEADQNEVDAVIENMVKDFAGRSEIAGELCWIAREYEMYPDKHELSKQMYERIIRGYPDSVEANEARLDIPRANIQFLIGAGDINEANALTDEFVADFNRDPYAGSCLGRIATQYYKTALAFKEPNRSSTSQGCSLAAKEQAKQYFEQAEGVWQRIIDKLPVQAGDTDNAYYFVAGCRQHLGRWEEALDYYQKVVTDWPDYKYAGGAQCAVGWSYEALRDEGKIPKEEANAIIEQAYTAVLTEYPDCYIAHYAAFQLAGMSVEKGDKAGAIAYYKKFLELAPAEHSRLAEVKAKLRELEGTNQ